MKTQAILDATL